MDIQKMKSIIEAMLFAAGREVDVNEIMAILEISADDVDMIIQNMKTEFEEAGRGIEIIKINNNYQLCTKKEYFDYIYPLFDNRAKPTLSSAALETLSIIAYNPKITRAEIESLRGVNSDGTIYKLLEHNLICEAGKSDAPGKPTVFKTTDEFLKLFGMTSLEELPELPKYKLDENEQIVIDEIIEQKEEVEQEAPMPEREETTQTEQETD